ncbi:MAG: flavohemoglobin expression-modulating QEGLA motif protein [Labilithrix sp.]|nr:flavohemoglobin expression-modulating QEGLA motif protein [Labilithrix sp.]MCW5816330.1 flavohemoglobin expression-modulating QEGLA motif protein [Labilithrix sp.]
MADRASSGESGRKGKESEEPRKNGAAAKSGSVPPPRPSRPTAVEAEEPRHPSIPPLPAAGPWRSYKEIVAGIAQRIVDAQKEIRVLQAVRWGNDIEEQFKKSRYRELPKVDASYYDRNELGFDAAAKVAVFEEIARDVDRDLGESDAIGAILGKTALEYRDVVRMLAARGTPVFYAYSRKLYGSPKDKFPDGVATLRDLGHLLYEILTNIDETALGTSYERNITAADAAAELNQRLTQYFGDAAVRVEVDDTILSDAAAGSDYVKVRSGAMFSQRDIDILEVHEGWVHVATSLNGQGQTVARWLSKGPPRTTTVQEGLAALCEIFTFRTYPRRARRLNDRVLAVDKTEDGASFLEVFEWFRTEGYDEEECFHNTRRIFRGGVVEGGAPFTKDACYCKGIVLNYAFIQSAIQHNRADLIPYLFVGKVAHEDVPVLARRVNDGVVRPPRYLPPMFRDLNAMAIWMAYSTFFARLGGQAISDHYAKLFARAG